MWVNNVDETMRKHYIAPTILTVMLSMHDGLLTSGSAVGVSDGAAVGDHQPTDDDSNNQFVKSYNQWGEEW